MLAIPKGHVIWSWCYGMMLESFPRLRSHVIKPETVESIGLRITILVEAIFINLTSH